jgi:hypothetical protein|tara:strand:- start:385 stop:600 length:216 start_codon:yes stop_codon:yes gene_type:complete
MINPVPVLPELDEDVLCNILGVFSSAQAVVGEREDPLPILRYGLLILLLFMKTGALQKSYNPFTPSLTVRT